MRKHQTAIIALALWLFFISGMMLLIQRVNLEIFFVLSLIGFLAIVQILSPKYTRPDYMRYTQYITFGATVLLGMIIAGKILEILAL
jgi:hypothetical protein